MEKNVTPMIRQYLDIKKKYKDAVLFFRVGSFYEMFFDDAIEVSKLLNLTLTKRENVPMCGVPYHTSKEYIRKLILFDKKVAICEQASNSTSGGPLEREVVEVITPGVIIDEDFLNDDINNYLVAISDYKDYYSFSYIDLSTSSLGIMFYENGFFEKLKRDLEKYSPKEIIVSENFYYEYSEKLNLSRFLINRVPTWHLDKDIAIKTIKEHFNILGLSSLGFDEEKPYYISIFLIINHIKNNLKNLLSNIDKIDINNDSSYMFLDDVTQVNLELVKNNNDFSSQYSLYSVLNDCKTAMGKRLLREFILNPILNISEINTRLDHVEFFCKNISLTVTLRETFINIWDIERIISRIQMKRYIKKDFLFIEKALSVFFTVKKLFDKHNFDYWNFDKFEEDSISKVYFLINSAISSAPDELIKRGYDLKLDNLKDLKINANKYIDQYLESERLLSKINNLKIRKTNNRGLFFEVTKSNYAQVPPHFMESQALNSSKRYKTEKLISLEVDINNAEDNVVAFEQEIFDEIASNVVMHNKVLKKVAEFFAYIDLVVNFGYLAKKNEYKRPVLTSGKEILLEKSRHPVVERYTKNTEIFTENFVRINKEKYFCLITGPNMAGKSTYLRQVALITLMAHIGSFVPASKALIGITDKIFCRIGASDNIAKGESTFLVEMNETANILRNATEKSLIIMDEVGRGTSTNDGLAIAYSIIEYILEYIKARSLFATHFHELSSINHQAFINLSMKIEKQGNDLVFLREVEEKPSLNSYGIYVARIAGLPLRVIDRANVILESLVGREGNSCLEFLPHVSSDGNDKEILKNDTDIHIKLNEYLELKNFISNIDINNITPFQSIELLNQIVLKVISQSS
ncbi:DNA mismatch repair protein MutS [Borreliella burgdorferi]|uniref:DNA mismatch repair protein MutS n=1 Tax=Borreliella burgdorferi 118a TaxID=476210 RepID=A0A7U8I7R6_BORBG|nr:DNA mismatch repair protein MutS [Borreliella burgdorferi]EEE18742.1 DNA mismatch repair protein MutS [Borreliella burgdorferi 72a]EEG98597.1 DNA mismatch repair protein MutS [Borreliella burgdorferi 118a]MCD2385916.1 DNA mismatch repair protein MutS [Borreliella burgdorferi]PRQ99568.1 DNA mismatch repair protein MutS [Borreliella burgdorferi]PRR34078.1 DNA mismatch repair protein MutS [Borreliella burgdorferi]